MEFESVHMRKSIMRRIRARVYLEKAQGRKTSISEWMEQAALARMGNGSVKKEDIELIKKLSKIEDRSDEISFNDKEET